jgi:hypothetical protein
VKTSLTGSSCRNIASKFGASAASGWYKVLVASVNRTVYCDMTTDNKAAYTMTPCIGCISVSQIDSVEQNGCTAMGMSMIIPRTQAHWTSMFNFVTRVLNFTLSNFFQTVPGAS